MAETLTLPGFVNAHSHTFQRALRGRAGGGDFWAWRELMLAEAERQTPETVRELYADDLPRDARRRLHGRRRVPLPRARRGSRRRRGGGRGRGRARRSCSPPTAAAGCRGCGRSRPAEYLRQLESLRADGDPGRRRPPLRPRLPARLARGARPLRGGRAAAAARPRRRAAARDRGVPRRARLPADRAARAHRLPRPARDGRPRDARGRRRARSARARAARTVCACPTTEADLGDGFLPAARIEHRRIALCIGSDSNVRIDPLEELRELEGIARRQTGTRGVFSTERLLCFGADEGGRSLGLESWPEIEIDLEHESLRGVDRGRRLRRARLELRRRRRRQPLKRPHPEARCGRDTPSRRRARAAPRRRRSTRSRAGSAAPARSACPRATRCSS